MPDGTFYVSDEYGPYITHFDATGRAIGRLSPLDGSLPVELRNRLPNRGMEGLTITPDGTMLVGMMQSALNQPDNLAIDPKKINITRLVTYQLVATPGSPSSSAELPMCRQSVWVRRCANDGTASRDRAANATRVLWIFFHCCVIG